MPPPDPALDRRFLIASIRVSAALGALGVGWGIATSSQMILLDGAYAVIGIVLSWLLLRASALADRGPTKRHPYGMEAATPLAVGVQGFVLLATLLYAMYEAALSIRSGGSEVTAGWAVAYGVIVTGSSIVFTRWITRNAGRSDVLLAESTGWRVATWRGLAIVVGFAALALIERSRWDAAAPYIDPAMVLLSCAALIVAPLRMIRSTVVELLEGVPADDVHEPVKRAVALVRERFGFDEPDLYVAKVGPKLYVEVGAAADGGVTIREEQAIRDELHRLLAPLPYEVWLTVELHPRTPNSDTG